MPLCVIAFKSTYEALNDFQKQELLLRGVDIFLNAAMRNRFQEYIRGQADRPLPLRRRWPASAAEAVA